jgi:Protein of unknown function (DUF551)
MSDWRPIESFKETEIKDILLWNGVRVFVGWLDEDGFHDSNMLNENSDPEDPQPTHWMPFPGPPSEDLPPVGTPIANA